MTPAWAQRREELLSDCLVSPDVFHQMVDRLGEFVVPYQQALETEAGQRNVHLYLQGLLSHLPGKNAEDIAAIPGERSPRVTTPTSPLVFRKHQCHTTSLVGTISHVDDVRLGVAMSIMAPKGRKHLCADALFSLVRQSFANITDNGADEGEMPLRDALMSAFAMFSLKSPSLLAFDKQRAEGNLQTIYGMTCVPCDTRMREILDPLSPALLRPLFQSVFRQLQRGKALEPMTFLEDYYLVALDGTGYFSSKTIHCASCLHKVHRNGSSTYYHQLLGAAIIHPDMREVIPLMPEPIVKQDGTTKNDCERNAAKRFLVTLRQDHPHLKFIVTEDSLSSNAPHIETLHHHALHYILGVKEGDHAYLFQQVQVAEHTGRVTYSNRHDRAAGVVHRFRFVNDMPLNESRSDVRVNFIEYWEVSPDKVQHFSL